MKRVLLALILSLCAPATWAAHFNCTLDAACTAAAPCANNVAGNFNDDGLCNGVAPANGGGHTYTVTVPSGRVLDWITDGVTLGSTGQTTAALTVSGTFTLRAATAGDAYNSLTLLPSSAGGSNAAIGIATTGKVTIGKSNRLLTDATASISRGDMAGGAFLSVEGETCTANIVAVYGPTENNTACGTTVGAPTENQYYVVELDGCVDLAKAGRRMQWENGDFRNQAVEIVAYDADATDLVDDACTGAGAPTIPGLPANYCTGAGAATGGILASPSGGKSKSRGAISFCTWRADATSGTLGQRLTGHVAVGNIATVDHWVPTMAGNDSCTGANAPDPWCTGSAAGTGWRIFPHVGDSVTVIDDAVIGVSAGTNVFAWNGANMSTFPKLRAFHTIGARMLFQSTGNTSTDVVNDVEYGNMHDVQQGGGLLTVQGWQNQTVRKTIAHDVTAGSAIGIGISMQMHTSNSTGPTPDYSGVEDSVFYRLSGDNFNWQTSGNTLAGTGCFARRNLFYAGCTRDDECNAVEVDYCKFGEITDNLAFDFAPLAPASADSGGCYRMTTDASVANAGLGTVFDRNICVNADGAGIKVEGGFGPALENATATANYVSNVGQDGIQVGRAYGNFARNWGLDKAAVWFGIDFSVKAYGNFLLETDAVVETGYCGFACFAQGLHPGGGTISATASISISDNVVKLNSGTPPMVGTGPGGSHNGAANFDHLTFDFNGRTATAAVYFGSWTPTANTVVNVRDLATTHANDTKAGECPADAQALVSFGTWTGNRSPTASERGALDAGPFGNASGCVTVGTRVNTGTSGLGFRDRVRQDYGYVRGAPAATLGAFPSGSALGSRAFRFNRDRFIWAFPWDLSAGDPTGETTTPWPANFSNGSCAGLVECNQDTEGDGVIDLWDNCDTVFNPNQYDPDGDGKGCVCDQGETCS